MPTNPMEYLFPGVIAAQAIYAAVKLRVPDALASGPRTIAELAAETGAHVRSLECLMRALCALAIFEQTPDGRWGNSPLSDVLRQDHPQSQRAGAMLLTSAFLWRPLGELAESVRTGKPAFDRVFGERFFAYLASHRDDAAIFNAAMTEGIAWTTSALLAAYDFSRFEELIDVGGGEGALLRDLLSATPGLRGVLFDLPEVVCRAPAILTGVVAARCRIVGGDFFQAVPEGADAYLLKGVIHDWPDEDAVQILRNVHRAMRPEGTLLLVEGLADSASHAGMSELLMLIVGGRERTEAEFRALLSAAGFALKRVVPAGGQALLECGWTRPGVLERS